MTESEQLRAAYEKHFKCLGGIYCLPDTKNHSVLCPRNKRVVEFKIFKLGWDARSLAETLPREEPGK